MTRRILQALRVDKIAAVDRPCQEHAVCTILKRDYSADARDKMAEQGHAMSDGSYPIKNKADLKNAVQSVGRAKSYAAAKKHIISRARAMGAVDMLPEDWGVKKNLPLADRIAKNIFVIPMNGNGEDDDDDAAVDFQEALEEKMECMAACDENEKLHPYFCALKDSIISIALDDTLDGPERLLRIRDSVGQFLDTIQSLYPDMPNTIDTAMTMKSLQGLRKRMLSARLDIIRKTWSDAAREAAAEARKKKYQEKLDAANKDFAAGKTTWDQHMETVMQHDKEYRAASLHKRLEKLQKVIGNTAKDYIDDFVYSDAPQFKGKSKEERIRMALGAFYSS